MYVQRDTDIWIGREETILICRYYDCICRKLKGRYREITGIKKNLANFLGYIKIYSHFSYKIATHRIVFFKRR